MKEKVEGIQQSLASDMDQTHSLRIGEGNQGKSGQIEERNTENLFKRVEEHFHQCFLLYVGLTVLLILWGCVIQLSRTDQDPSFQTPPQVQRDILFQKLNKSLINSSDFSNEIKNKSKALEQGTRMIKKFQLSKSNSNETELKSIKQISKSETSTNIFSHEQSLKESEKLIKKSKNVILPKDNKTSKEKDISQSIKSFNNSQIQYKLTKTSPTVIAGVSKEQKQQAIRWLNIKNDKLQFFSPIAKQQKEYYQKNYNISQYEELPFCIVIPSYNNANNNLHLKNIKSVLMQDYTNYHVVFIDDASTDRTGEQIDNFLKNQTKLPPQRYIVIRNTEQKRAMPNLRRAAKEFCKPNDIFLIVDGDDQLIGRQVLKLFNAIFQHEKGFFVYSNFLSIRHTVGYSRPFPKSIIEANRYRYYPFVTSHLRAFYTQLFLNIKEEDLKDNEGNYLRAANDVAICIPILQMAQDRVSYVPELTYYYNSNTGQNNHQLRLKEQKGNDKMLRKRNPYPRLQNLFSPSRKQYPTPIPITFQLNNLNQSLYSKSN